MIGMYILDGRVPVPTADCLEWGMWMELNRDKMRVGQDTIDTAWVSTVFLGLDHSFMGGPPLLFETMVFDPDPELDTRTTRCSTWAQAEVMHDAACNFVWRRKLPFILTGVIAFAAILGLVVNMVRALA
jgi:hypothetical protein